MCAQTAELCVWYLFLRKGFIYFWADTQSLCTVCAPWIKLLDAVNESNKVFYVFPTYLCPCFFGTC